MNKFIDLLIKEEVLLKGHFLLTSGLHSEWYFEKFRLVENPSLLSLFVKELLSKIHKDYEKVVGPFTGGAMIAYEAARQAGVKCIFAEKSGDQMTIRRGKGLKKGEKVLLVDDVLTTGGSILKTIKAVEEKKAEITAIGILIDRSEKHPGFDYTAVVKYPVKNYNPEDCPLCKKRIPLLKLGG